MVRQRDPFWEYAKDLRNGRFVCKYCQRDFAGGISRIKSHLSGVRGRDVDICSNVPDDVQSAACEEIGVPNPKTHPPNKKAKILPMVNSGGEITVMSTSSPLSLKGLHHSTMIERPKGKEKIAVDKKLAKHFIMNSIPFDVIETPAFVDFVNGVAEFGSGYELPSFSTLQEKVVPDFTEEVEEYIKNVKKSWGKTGCTLICDSGNGTDHIPVNFMVYCPSGVVFMKSFEASEDGITGVFLKDTITSLIETIGPEHVVQIIIGGNVDNFESTWEMLTKKYPRTFNTRCVAGEIQSLLMDIYNEVEWVRNTVNIAKVIITYVQKNNIELPIKRERIKSKEYKSLSMNRFASKFSMLQSILEVKSELQAALQLCNAFPSCDWRATVSNEQGAKHFEVSKILNNKKYWSRAKKLVQVLQPLFQVFHLVDDDGSTLGYLYEAMERAKDAIMRRYNKNQIRYKRILELFEERRNYFIVCPIHAAAAFLNPSYMCSENFREDREMKEGINFILEKLVAEEEKEPFCREVLLYREKVSNLFTGTAMIMLKTLHPRLWWDFCGDHLPILKKYAVRILSQPCSSSLCKTNKLHPRMSDDLVLRMNIMMMEKFGMSKAQDLEPIDLDKFSGYPELIDCDNWEDEDCDSHTSDSIIEICDD